MVVKWSHLIIVFVVLSYPANLAMMRFGVGGYNNDMNHEWKDTNSDVRRGPSREGRLASFVISPVAVPCCVMMCLINSTIPSDSNETIQLHKENTNGH